MERCWTKQTDKRGAGAVGDRLWESSLKHGSYGKLHRILRFTLGMSTLVTKCKKKKKSDSSDTGVKKKVGEGLAPGLNDSFMALCSSS